jgi:hypothetical protein
LRWRRMSPSITIATSAFAAFTEDTDHGNIY